MKRARERAIRMMAMADSGSRGPARKQIEPSQGIEFLELLRSGYGRKMACMKVGIGYHRFMRQMRGDRDFARDVRTVEAARTESCERLLYRLVNEPCDTPLKLRAAIAYLARRDKIEDARRGRREKAKREREAEAKTA